MRNTQTHIISRTLIIGAMCCLGAGSALAGLGDELEKAGNRIGKETQKGAKQVSKETQKGADQVQKEVGKGAQQVGKELKKGGQEAEDSANRKEDTA